MIDYRKIKNRGSYCHVYFKNLPEDILSGAIYVENEYHPRMNRYLQRWGWWLRKRVLNKYEYGYAELTYVPGISQQEQRKLLKYQFPFLPKEASLDLPKLKTMDLLDYLEDPDDARFLKPGFLFYSKDCGNGLSIYDYYPLVGLKDIELSYKKQITEIFYQHRLDADKNRQYKNSVIGHSGVPCTECPQDEDYADNMFKSLDAQTQAKVSLFKKQVEELQKRGVPLDLLEMILHRSERLSKLVITKDHRICLPDYNDIEVKMEPLVKAVYLLFLKHPEGIVFKGLADYREELLGIYKTLKPMGLSKRTIQSIEDVTNPLLNSINEKCARIRSAFVKIFDEHLAKNYFITGERGEPKKIVLPRDLVVWEE